MKTSKLIFLFLIVTIAFFNCSNEKTTDGVLTDLDASIYYEELNISYGENPDQKFDLYLPANRSTNTKVIILVHGGGWSSGDKSDMNDFKNLIRTELPNLAIVNINYRLADEDNKPYPMQIDDISSVINYLKENRAYYTISDNYGFIGVSAGAHLSLLWSYGFDTNSNVKMACSIVGPTNLADTAYLNNTSPELQELLDLYGINSEISFLEEVSPYYRATVSSPPTILFYGGQDPLIPTTQGTDMRDKLESLGVTNQFTLYPDAGHGWVGLELLDTWTKLKAFIQAHL